MTFKKEYLETRIESRLKAYEDLLHHGFKHYEIKAISNDSIEFELDITNYAMIYGHAANSKIEEFIKRLEIIHNENHLEIMVKSLCPECFVHNEIYSKGYFYQCSSCRAKISQKQLSATAIICAYLSSKVV